MLILAVDTSTRSGSFALLRNEAVVSQLAPTADEPYSATLMAGVESLLRQSGFTLSDIELFAVATGPGSFTGLRVGLTAVKAWAEVFGRPVAGVSVLHAIAIQVSPSMRASGDFVAPLLDAHRGQVFGGLFRTDTNEAEILVEAGPEVVLTAEEFVQYVGKQAGDAKVLFSSPTPEVLAGVLARSRYDKERIEGVSPLLAPSIGLLGYRKALRNDLVDALGLDANYVRRSDAELHWKE